MVALASALIDDISHDKQSAMTVIRYRDNPDLAKTMNDPVLNLMLEWKPDGYADLYKSSYDTLIKSLRATANSKKFIPGRITQKLTGLKGEYGRIFLETGSYFASVDVRNVATGGFPPLIGHSLLEFAWAKTQLPKLLSGPWRVSDLRDAFSKAFIDAGIVNSDHIVKIGDFDSLRFWDNVNVRGDPTSDALDPALEMEIHAAAKKYRSDWNVIVKAVLATQSSQALSNRIIADPSEGPVYDCEIYDNLLHLRDVHPIYIHIFVILNTNILFYKSFSQNIQRRLSRMRHGNDEPVLRDELTFDLPVPPVLYWDDVDTYDTFEKSYEIMKKKASKASLSSYPSGTTAKRVKLKDRQKTRDRAADIKRKQKSEAATAIVWKGNSKSQKLAAESEDEDAHRTSVPKASSSSSVRPRSQVASCKSSVEFIECLWLIICLLF